MQSARRLLAALVVLALLGATAAAQAPPPRQPLRLVANVPAGRLDLVRGYSVEKSYPISVGTSKHPTPVGTFWISSVIWNPR